MSTLVLEGRAARAAWMEEIRATLWLAWPMVLTNVAQTAMTATDIMMMGRLGANTVAAGALGANLYFAPLMFGLGLMLATSPMIASELGRRRHSVRDIRRTVRQGLWSAFAVSVPMWAILWNAEGILLAMGQQPDLSAAAGEYMRTLMWGILPFYGYVVLRSFISALERPGWALAIVFAAVGFNVLANWCLMFGHLGFPAMGLAGSGLATTLSNLLMFLGLAGVVSYDRTFGRYRLFGRFWRADWPRFRALWRLGLPIAAMVAFEVTIFNVSAFLMGLINAPSLAAHAIALQIASISFMVPLGLGQAVTVRVGRAYGAGDAGGVTRAGWTAYSLSLAFMSVMALTMFTFPRELIGLFLDVNDPANTAVIAIGVSFLAYAALFQIVDGAQAVGSGMLRGLHDTTVPMIFAGIGYWGIGLPLGALLAFRYGFGGVGIWIGLSTGLAAVALLLLMRWLMRMPPPARRVAA
ncbi:MATE family efflux transporter [Mesorhizobium australicum]|uniref:Multidrug-efflux transporter n=1 Tax=Mesorhizobium australicum TaxID=536018 RepID=A0A1X7PCM0_9HYPH|nr:MATE family efflux transporter [Mesorhizobium australicum]SMH48460.1 multidrug resistance protein, MATE family [Mesorhizobium australicum]